MLTCSMHKWYITHTHTHMQEQVLRSICTYTHIYTLTHRHACIYVLRACRVGCVYMHVYIHTHRYAHTYMYTYLRTHVHTHTCMYVCVYKWQEPW